MTTSDKSWSTKFRRIGECERNDHVRLSEDDYCAYFGEYTPAGDTGKPAWALSEANSILINLKKHPSKKSSAEWKYKLEAIKHLGKLIRENLNEDHLRRFIFVPVPPSTSENDPDHDQRMLQVAKAIGEDVDARPILETVSTRQPARQSGEPRSIAKLRSNMRINVEQADKHPTPKELIVLDDMITTGATFVACKELLTEYYGDIRIYGLFIVRRVLPKPFYGGEGTDF